MLNNARKHAAGGDDPGCAGRSDGEEGVEIIVGTMTDKTFGPMVMVGLGGITTELFRDVVYRPAPVSAEEAGTHAGELKAAPLLNGFRGAAKADVAAVAQLIRRHLSARRAA